MITGLIGLRPRLDDTIEINPLIPADKWDWFCLDNVLYHGHNLTILWDKNGDRYHCGKGLYKARLKFSRKVTAALMEEGVDALAHAKAVHDQLEALYNPHVDFEG